MSKWQSRVRNRCSWGPTAGPLSTAPWCCSRRSGKGTAEKGPLQGRPLASGPAPSLQVCDRCSAPRSRAGGESHLASRGMPARFHCLDLPGQQRFLGKEQQARAAPPTQTRAPARSLRMTLGVRPVAAGVPSSRHRLCDAPSDLLWVKHRTWGWAQRPHHPEEKPLPSPDFTMGH